MYHNLEVPAQCEALWQECQSLVPVLLRDCAIKAKDRVLDAGTPIKPGTSSVYLIKEGEIHESYEGELIVIHQQGDLVNADALSHPKPNMYETDFVVTVDEYDGQALLDAIAGDSGKFQAWSRYLSCLSQSYQLLMCYFSRQDSEYLPDFRSYKKGDVIIEENTDGDEVFTLLNGSAKAMSNNEEVGEIKKDEIFGAIAIRSLPRAKTFVASSRYDLTSYKN